MRKIILILSVLCVIQLESVGQSNVLDGYYQLNMIDSLLSAKDTLMAIDQYEQLNTTERFVKAGRHLAFSDTYFSQKKKEKAKEEILKAVNKGLLGLSYLGDNPDRLFKKIKSLYGRKFLNTVKSNHANKIKKQLLNQEALLAQLKYILEKDQELRRNKDYKNCKRYNFNRRLGFAYDSTQVYSEMKACFEEFRYRDSIVLQQFVNIVDSIGYVPGSDLVYGMVPISPIICHLAHFNFKGIEDKLLYSLFKGTISPEVYAWYIGYKEEYFQLDHTFYFTNNEQDFDKMSDKKINEINTLRNSIGLKSVPAVLWNSTIY